MATYLERYINGEYEQVWAELLTFGDKVQQEPLYSDAVAVARETMTRAKYNVEVLYQRLLALEYKFEYPELALTPPPSDVHDQIARVESEIGAIPLSIKTWHEIVNGVYFSGTHPRLSICERDYVPKGENSLTSDALCVYAIDMPDPYLPTYFGDEIIISPDIFHKCGFSGGAAYRIITPDMAIDAPLVGEWHDTTFVNYLRISFRWGGFPGFDSSVWPIHIKEIRQQNMPAPHDLIAELTHGLKPL